MLVWDDQSNNLGLYSGLMGTHDEETLAYFKGTKVKCVLCARQGGAEDSLMQVRPQGAVHAPGDCRRRRRRMRRWRPAPSGSDAVRV
jgi:hypothetical protein